jgi:hypothetical protein
MKQILSKTIFVAVLFVGAQSTFVLGYNQFNKAKIFSKRLVHAVPEGPAIVGFMTGSWALGVMYLSPGNGLTFGGDIATIGAFGVVIESTGRPGLTSIVKAGGVVLPVIACCELQRKYKKYKSKNDLKI